MRVATEANATLWMLVLRFEVGRLVVCGSRFLLHLMCMFDPISRCVQMDLVAVET